MPPLHHRHFLGANAILDLGLSLVGANEKEWTTKHTTRIKCFKTFYGSHPIVCSKIWDDLFMYQVDEERKINYLLMCLHFFKEYDKESDLSL